MRKVRIHTTEGDWVVPVYYDKRLDVIDDPDAIFCISGSKRMLGKVRRIKINAAADKLSDWALQGLIYSKQVELALGMYIWRGGFWSIPVNLYRLVKKVILWRHLDDLSYLLGGARYIQLLRETDHKNADKRISRLLQQEETYRLSTYFLAYFEELIPVIVMTLIIIGFLLKN